MRKICIYLIFIVIGCKQSELIEEKFLFPVFNKYNKYGFINVEGKNIIPFKFDSVLTFSDGLAAYYCDSLWGFINKKGEIVIPAQYSKVSPFSDGMCEVTSEKNNNLLNFFINKSGEKCFPTTNFTRVGSFQNNRCFVEINNSINYVNKCGEIIIKTNFPYGSDFQDGIATLWNMRDSLQYVDTTGKIMMAYSIKGGINEFTEGLTLVWLDKGYYINRNGIKIITIEKNDYGYFNFSDGMARVSEQCDIYSYKQGFINKTGKTVIPLIYENAYDFKEGLSGVMINGKYGFINKEGKIIIKPEFEVLYNFGFENGLCFVRKNNLKTYINHNGEIVWQEEK